MRNLCDAAYMSYDVTALPFQAHANYGTWSIDFDQNVTVIAILAFLLLLSYNYCSILFSLLNFFIASFLSLFLFINGKRDKFSMTF